MATSASLFLLLLLVSTQKSFAFESDELVEDDEEWGLIGGIPPMQTAAPQIVDVDATKRPRPSLQSDSSSSSDTKVQFDLEHAFGHSDFSLAGVFTARLRTLPHGGQTLTKLRLARSKFTKEEQNAFEDLLKGDGFYKIRVPENVLNPGQRSVLSSVKARCLSAANLQERFDFYMDKGNVIAVGYGTAGDCWYPRILNNPTRWSFDSHIVLKSGEQATRIAVMNDELDNNSDDVPTKKLPEKSFWAKYWMYIVPAGLILLNIITQVANMPAEQVASQGSAQGAPQRTISGGTRRR
eukprot:c20031_g1_i2 orf=80-964(+)